MNKLPYGLRPLLWLYLRPRMFYGWLSNRNVNFWGMAEDKASDLLVFMVKRFGRALRQTWPGGMSNIESRAWDLLNPVEAAETFGDFTPFNAQADAPFVRQVVFSVGGALVALIVVGALVGAGLQFAAHAADLYRLARACLLGVRR